MLKPNKKNTQKELKRDPFLESVDSAQAHYEENKKLYTQVISGVLIIITAFLFLSNKNKAHVMEGEIALGKALIAVDKNELSNAKFQLETVINDYPNTKPSFEAAYFLGKIYYEEGDFESAKKHITIFKENSDNEMLLVSSAKVLADIEMKNDNLDNAISIITDLKRSVNLNSQKNSLELDEARLLISNGIIEDARNKINSILDKKDVSNAQKQVAEQLLGQISS